jgi:putative Mn2+ efflux pump MntP
LWSLLGYACGVSTNRYVSQGSSPFVLPWGPIVGGLIAAIIGFFIGYSIYSFIKKQKLHSKQKHGKHEVTVIIQSTVEQAQLISNILWHYQAHAVGQVQLPSEGKHGDGSSAS